MTNPHEHEVEARKVQVRCPDCRTSFHERVGRIIHGDRVTCPACRCELRFSGIGQMHEHETVQAFLHHVEERTRHPHYNRTE